MKINEKDLLIVSCLRQNSRMKLTDMSRTTRIPVSTLFDKTKVYDNGLIRKYTSLIRFESLGYHAKTLILLSTGKKERHKLQEILNTNDNVNSLHKVNNGYDFLVEAIFPGVKEVESFIEELEEQVKLKGKKILYIIDELKREEFLANPQKEKLLRRLTI
jgi:DNA-binding Lrp family transcriptional regulator